MNVLSKRPLATPASRPPQGPLATPGRLAGRGGRRPRAQAKSPSAIREPIAPERPDDAQGLEPMRSQLSPTLQRYMMAVALVWAFALVIWPKLAAWAG